MNKPGPLTAKPLSALLGNAINDAFAKQGFASRELVTRWADIVGAHVAAHSEPLKIQWPRPVENQQPEPATLVLRVEGPMALEIQHTSDVILERVNRFFGWQAVGRIALRQAPLSRRPVRQRRKRPTPRRSRRPKRRSAPWTTPTYARRWRGSAHRSSEIDPSATGRGCGPALPHLLFQATA
jgi:hypothetical protein